MINNFLIIWLVTGQPLYFKQQPSGCHDTFDKLTHTKTIKNSKGRTQIATFYMGTEVLVYRCFDYDTARLEN
jgi:hypothetical protein